MAKERPVGLSVFQTVPEYVEAIQITAENKVDIARWLGQNQVPVGIEFRSSGDPWLYVGEGKERRMAVEGNWVVLYDEGSAGVLCGPEFDESYSFVQIVDPDTSVTGGVIGQTLR